MSKLAKALTAAAGNAAGESLYVEDVFSTYLYTGTGDNQTNTVTNGIDLDGEGGMVWTKGRDIAYNPIIFDSERGLETFLYTNGTSAQANQDARSNMSFNSDGYSFGSISATSWGPINEGNYNFASWTFRKAEKFFDVVTYTGDGVAGRTVSHNLGSVPAVIIVKRLSGTTDWNVYHSSLGATKRIKLNTTDAEQTLSNVWNNTSPTDSVFTLGTSSNVNNNGDSYVAYLFASDAGGFGDDGSESIIKCGSYTGTGSAGLEVNLGFEPQWILVKGATSGAAYDWYLVDNMRGITTGGNDPLLWPNKSDAEDTLSNIISVTATGFKLEGTGWGFNRSSEDYIYIAIRRPMKTPESGTEVFAAADDRLSPLPGFVSGFPVDFAIRKYLAGGGRSQASARLTQGTYLDTADTAAEYTSASQTFDYMDGYYGGGNSGWFSWMFKRATGFFDVVAYTGNGTAGRTVAHNLGVAPELMIFKNRSQSGDNWVVYSDVFSPTNYIKLNNTAYAVPDSANLRFNNTAPTKSVFTVGTSIETNWNGQNYISYHFATLAGVSKVGSYTGTGNSLDIDCGFSNGARFVMIKRTDSSSDWWVWDSERGIVSGNDPTLRLNSTAAETTAADYIDPLSSGFTLTTAGNWLYGMNYPSGNYIFLAIA